MKKTPLLNSEISRVISQMGHTDSIAIGDAGLPIPSSVERIDLAIIKNLPTFIDTLKAILTELQVEEVEIAREIKDASPEVYESIAKEIGNAKITWISHEELKENLKKCKAVVRTGEQTPYANIILKSGVVF